MFERVNGRRAESPETSSRDKTQESTVRTIPLTTSGLRANRIRTPGLSWDVEVYGALDAPRSESAT